jgi:signal transduction histidine kinase
MFGYYVYKSKKNLHTVINDEIEVSKSIAKIKNISIKFIQSDVVEINTDINMLKTILQNLISNAIKFTHLNGEINIFPYYIF